MHSVLATALFALVVIAAIVGVMSLIGRTSPYDEIAKGPFGLDREGEGERAPLGGSAQAERALEIRQMLEARSARAVREGGDPLDVEAELERLLGAPPSAGEAPRVPADGPR